MPDWKNRYVSTTSEFLLFPPYTFYFHYFVFSLARLTLNLIHTSTSYNGNRFHIFLCVVVVIVLGAYLNVLAELRDRIKPQPKWQPPIDLIIPQLENFRRHPLSTDHYKKNGIELKKVWNDELAPNKYDKAILKDRLNDVIKLVKTKVCRRGLLFFLLFLCFSFVSLLDSTSLYFRFSVKQKGYDDVLAVVGQRLCQEIRSHAD